MLKLFKSKNLVAHDGYNKSIQLNTQNCSEWPKYVLWLNKT